MSTLNNQTVHTGNTIQVQIKGTVVGRVQSLTANQDFAPEAVREIGNYMPVEHVFTQYDGTLTLNGFVLRKGSLERLGLIPLGEKVLETGLIDIVIVDKQTKDVVQAFRGCSIQTHDLEITTNAISASNSTWKFLSTNAVRN